MDRWIDYVVNSFLYGIYIMLKYNLIEFISHLNDPLPLWEYLSLQIKDKKAASDEAAR